MSELLRALVVILILSSIAFFYAKALTPQFITQKNFRNRRNTWLVLTTIAFISHSFWIYAAIAALYLLSRMREESNVIALYFFILFVLPTGKIGIPGFGLVNYLTYFSHQTLLAFVILLPAYAQISSKKYNFNLGKILPDKLLVTYLIYLTILFFRDTTLTDALRQLFNSFVGVFLPYYVISRYIKNMEQFRDAILSLLIALIAMAFLATFEHFKGWLLYAVLPSTLGLQDMTSYLGRAGSLRAIVTAGHSIALGYAIAVAIGLFFYYREFTQKKSAKTTGLLILALGTFSAVSRAPWMGAILIYICFTLTGRNPIQKLMLFFIAGLLSLAALAVIPGGNKIIDLLPYIGNVERGTITYREDLYTNSMIVIARNPWTGSPNYLDNPEMKAMTSWYQVVDIVNTYLGIALQSGYIGVGLFTGFFISLLYLLLKSLKLIPDKNSEMYVLGRVLVAIICGIMFMIVTTSPIGVVEIIYWIIAALAAAYINMVHTQHGKTPYSNL